MPSSTRTANSGPSLPEAESFQSDWGSCWIVDLPALRPLREPSRLDSLSFPKLRALSPAPRSWRKWLTASSSSRGAPSSSAPEGGKRSETLRVLPPAAKRKVSALSQEESWQPDLRRLFLLPSCFPSSESFVSKLTVPVKVRTLKREGWLRVRWWCMYAVDITLDQKPKGWINHHKSQSERDLQFDSQRETRPEPRNS